MLADEELTEAMHAAVSRFGPPSTDLVAAGAQRGRAIRRRRGAVRALGASTACAVLAAAGAFAVHVLDVRPAGSVAAPAATRALTPAASAGHSGTPSGEPTAAGPNVIGILRQLLPHDDLASVSAQPLFSSAKLTDSQGSVLLEVNDQPDASSLESSLYPCSARTPAGYLKPTDVAECHDVAVPDGAHLEILTESEQTAIGPLYFQSADFCTAQGWRVVLTEVNSTLDNGEGAPTRPGEILTNAELAALVQSPLWTAA